MLELRDLESRILRCQKEDETKFKELRVRVAGIVEAVSHLTSHLSSCTINTSIVGCGEMTKELSEDINMELHGYVEYIEESQVEEPSSKECRGNVKEKSNVAGVDNELKEIDREVDSITSDFLPTLINSLDDPVEPSSSTLESKRIRALHFSPSNVPFPFSHHSTFKLLPATASLPASAPSSSPPPPSLPRPSLFITPSLPLTLPLCLYPSVSQRLSAAQRHSLRPSLLPAQVQPRCLVQFLLTTLLHLLSLCSVQFPAPRMSDKGKAIATASKKRKRSKTSTPSPYANYAKNPLNDEEKENQLLPSTDPTKFSNLYCELRLSRYAKTKLNIEKKLNLPNDVRHAINARISELGLDFVDRDLGRINISWVKKFYCNFFRQNLDSVYLRGREIMITEDALQDALLCRVGTPETCAYQQAEVALLSMTFDYEALRRVIATPDASWVIDSSNTKPKGMLFAYLTREARTWQQIFAHYVFPTTHFSEIPMDMLVLIGCVMEGKEVYFPRLIRHSMWRAHIRGLLPFPTLVTSLAELADVPWEDNDVTPPPPDDDDKEVTISWGVWVHEKPPTSRRSRARAAVEAAIPSSSTAAPAPPPAPEPTYLLVQHLLRFMERFERRVMRRLDRIDQVFTSQGIELPPLPESSASDEQDPEEEHNEGPIQ
ncbi:hypothetical protein Ahy_B08g090532 [Arachis hypogaea]|uniref:Putative plant transposon protein domain-containing protein n=1 Tax=Arachis hypogaea TaxID=3818 RepID=A0A444Y085_ARAHY|nr:hypothetical protein Ahy_B08g090532 [Arachis hypogaea]